MCSVGYATEFAHLQHEYKANPPPWSKHPKQAAH